MLPCLLTSRLVLRQADFADFPCLYEQWQLPSVARFLFAGRNPRVLCAPFFREVAMDAKRGFGLWSFRQHHSAEIVGCAGLLNAPWACAAAESEMLAAEVIVHVHPAFWGRGYAREGLMAVIACACEFPCVAHFFAVVDDRNFRSVSLFQRLGFLPDHAIPDTCLRMHRLSRVQSVPRDESTNITNNLGKKSCASIKIPLPFVPNTVATS